MNEVRKVLITGAAGFIGKNLAKYLTDAGYEIFSMSRNIEEALKILPQVKHFLLKFDIDYLTEIIDGCHAVINLAGASIGGRKWTPDYKKIILDSRISVTAALAEAIKKADDNKPNVLISASAVGYYGDTGIEEVDESAPAGRDFLANVCSNWEESAMAAADDTRVVIPRIGVVLDKSEGALPKMAAPYKYYFGGQLGSGRQWLSWIYIQDLCRLFLYALQKDDIKGAVNFCAPNPIRNAEFSICLGAALKKPAIMTVPAFALKLMLGESASMALTGQRVIPQKALDAGFKFDFEYVDEALGEIYK